MGKPINAVPLIQVFTRAALAGGNALVREADRLFKPFGITAAYFNVLTLLMREQAGLRPSELTRALVVDPSSTTYLLDRMEKRGWLRRSNDPRDRRALIIVLTPAGRELYGRAFPYFQTAQANLAELLGMKDPHEVIRILELLPQAAKAAIDAMEATPVAINRAGGKKP